MNPLRLLLGALAVGAAVPGVWALAAPRSFYDDFPGPTSWVSKLPEYSEHLVTDVGAFYLAFAVLWAWAAARPSRALIVPLGVAWSAFSVLHLVFHVTNLDGFGTGDAIAQTATLVVVLAGALLAIALSRDERVSADVTNSSRVPV